MAVVVATAALDGNVVRSVFVNPALQGQGIGRLLMITWTWPLNPVVPLSISGTSAMRHILFTCRLASRLSSALKTSVKLANHARLNCDSLMFA